MTDAEKSMAELVAEVLDRHRELTVSQSFRVLWALKLTTLLTLFGLLIGVGFSIGRWSATSTSEAAPQPQYAFDINVRAFDENLPKLSDAKFDKRSLEEFGAAIEQKRKQVNELTGVQQALQSTKSVYADDIGKRFEWSGTITRFSVALNSPKGKIIDVQIKSGDYSASCYFDEHGHMGRLLSLKEGDPISVTGVLADYGKLVRCEFTDKFSAEISVKIE
jgi:hypothetical protein